ncbi:hypothetical protein BCT73_06500 [Vibrio breoganii]|nr:hypothetical protein BCU81_00010 [Vibrio breoganii]PML61236.1 hypothetical protein BCT73_06500 [Vibrio breoganii]PMO27673.1 hypothetical protein BCT13_16895 [Vibrio breoganii]PMO80133.1 hypothetical protein BCT00_15425 [Vibrio breoganii]
MTGIFSFVLLTRHIVISVGKTKLATTPSSPKCFLGQHTGRRPLQLLNYLDPRPECRPRKALEDDWNLQFRFAYTDIIILLGRTKLKTLPSSPRSFLGQHTGRRPLQLLNYPDPRPGCRPREALEDDASFKFRSTDTTRGNSIAQNKSKNSVVSEVFYRRPLQLLNFSDPQPGCRPRKAQEDDSSFKFRCTDTTSGNSIVQNKPKISVVSEVFYRRPLQLLNFSDPQPGCRPREALEDDWNLQFRFTYTDIVILLGRTKLKTLPSSPRSLIGDLFNY